MGVGKIRAVVLVKCLMQFRRKEKLRKGVKYTTELVCIWCHAIWEPPCTFQGCSFGQKKLVQCMCILWKCKVSRMESEMEVSGVRV